MTGGLRLAPARTRGDEDDGDDAREVLPFREREDTDRPRFTGAAFWAVFIFDVYLLEDLRIFVIRQEKKHWLGCDLSH